MALLEAFATTSPGGLFRLYLVAFLLIYAFTTTTAASSGEHRSHGKHIKHHARRAVTSPIERGTDVLTRRDSYLCDADTPCSNGACCGASGVCGYGTAYCGTGCMSNCNATAECGKDAATPGQTCPLNVCCSQYGFVSVSLLFFPLGIHVSMDLFIARHARLTWLSIVWYDGRVLWKQVFLYFTSLIHLKLII